MKDSAKSLQLFLMMDSLNLCLVHIIHLLVFALANVSNRDVQVKDSEELSEEKNE